MKSIHWGSGAKGCAFRSRLWILVVVGTGASIAHAQSPAVTIEVHTPDKETTKKPLKVRAIPKFDGAKVRPIILSGKYFNHTAKFYSYKISGLQQGAYDIVVCDERDYRPEVQTATVGPGPGGSTVFFLQDQPKGNVTFEDVRRVDDRLVGEGVPVYLVHTRTKCIVAQTLTDRKSHYAFRDLPKEEEYEVSFYETDP